MYDGEPISTWQEDYPYTRRLRRRQYAEDGLAGLEDAARPGGPKTVLTDAAVCQILAATVTPPP